MSGIRPPKAMGYDLSVGPTPTPESLAAQAAYGYVKYDVPNEGVPNVTSVPPEAPNADEPVVPRLMLQLPKLYPKQAAFVHDAHRYTVCFASTKSGKSSGLLIWGIGKSWTEGGPGLDGYWIAPTYGVAKIMYLRLQRWLIKMDPDKTTWKSNDSEAWIELHHGGRIYFKGGERPDLLYGPDAIWVVIDEGTRCREEVFHAARSIVTKTDGPIKIIGNMKNRAQWMYKMWERGRQGDPDIGWYLLDAWDAVEGGVLKRSNVEDAQRNLPVAVFNALYLCKPDEDAGNPFGYKAIQAARGPGSMLATKAIGVDLAKSVDWTVVLGLDLYGGCTQFERWQGPWAMTMAKVPGLIAGVPTLVDSTGVGDPVLETWQRDYTGLKLEGYKFTSSSKQVLMEGLAVALQQGEVSQLPDEVAAELEMFEYEYTKTGVRYSAPEGMHDDCVMALALAVHKKGRSPKRRAVAPATTALESPYEGAE